MSLEVGIIKWNEKKNRDLNVSLRKNATGGDIDFNNEHVVETYFEKDGVRISAQENKNTTLLNPSSKLYRTGSESVFAINKSQVVVECHYGKKFYNKPGAKKLRDIYYNIGDVKNAEISWRNSKTPDLDQQIGQRKHSLSVDINNSNLVAIAYNGARPINKTSGTTIRIGVIKDNKIDFLLKDLFVYEKPFSNKSGGYASHETSICITDDNIIILFTKNFNHIPYYSLGKYSDGKIDWWQKQKQIFSDDRKTVNNFSAAINSKNNHPSNKYEHYYNEIVYLYGADKVLKYKFAEIDKSKKKLKWVSDVGRYNLPSGITVSLDMDGKYMDTASRTSISIDDSGKVVAAISNKNGVSRLTGNIDGLVINNTTEYLTTVKNSENVSKDVVLGILSVASAIPTKFSSVFKVTKSLTEMSFKASMGEVEFNSSMSSNELRSITVALTQDRIDQEIAKTAIMRIVETYADYKFYFDSYKEDPEKFDNEMIDKVEALIAETHSPGFRTAISILGDPSKGRFAYTYYLIGSALLLFSLKFYAVKQAYRINQNTGEINDYSDVTLNSFNNTLDTTKEANLSIDLEAKKHIQSYSEGLITRRKENTVQHLVNHIYGGNVNLKKDANNLLSGINTDDWPRPEIN